MPSAKLKRPRDPSTAVADRPEKRTKLLLGDDSSEDSSSSDAFGGIALKQEENASDQASFKVNEEYARRFEHNQRRAEIHRLEEKYGNGPAKAGPERIRGNSGMNEEGSEWSSTSEEEDDEGILALGPLDDQFTATLEAIRRKDPRVYDEKVTFYSKYDDENEEQTAPKSKDKPMYLKDYHRENLLSGNLAAEDEDVPPPTYAQQQEDLKHTIVKEMHAAAKQLSSEATSASDDSHGDNDGFLVKKRPVNDYTTRITHVNADPLDVENADKDPEMFLSNFMSARAWVPAGESKSQPFESDDDEEDQRAEAFEAAYNLRFENQQPSNEKLVSIARDAAAKYSVRKDVTNSRKRARELDHERKEAENYERAQEKARLRKLKIEEAAEKVRKIKEAAGLRGKALDVENWSEFLTEDWDDERWEQEMKHRFGDSYYADQERDSSDTGDKRRRRRLKKPRWEDDIDITDLVPEFNAEEEVRMKEFTLSGDSGSEDSVEGTKPEHTNAADTSKKPKSFRQDKEERKKAARRERRKLEQLVDGRLNIELALDHASSRKARSGLFRYRETSPLAYGLTPHDILMASDSQLNQYAGLKKIAAFREADKKKKDKKHLGKKARLRQWRRDTFGDEHGPRKSLQELLAEQLPAGTAVERESAEATRGEGKSNKRTRSKKSMKVVSS